MWLTAKTPRKRQKNKNKQSNKELIILYQTFEKKEFKLGVHRGGTCKCIII